MQVVHVAIEHALDGFGVVEHAVVSGLRERQHARLDLLGIHALEQRVGLDLGLDGCGLELALRDRADDAEVVARGLQEDRPDFSGNLSASELFALRMHGSLHRIEYRDIPGKRFPSGASYCWRLPIPHKASPHHWQAA